MTAPQFSVLRSLSEYDQHNWSRELVELADALRPAPNRQATGAVGCILAAPRLTGELVAQHREKTPEPFSRYEASNYLRW